MKPFFTSTPIELACSLNGWLEIVTKGLPATAVAQVRDGIQRFYFEIIEVELASGKDLKSARRAALEGLGNPAVAHNYCRKIYICAAYGEFEFVVRESFSPVSIVHPLEMWIVDATHGLCDGSVQRIGEEIREHVAVAIQNGLREGKSRIEAEQDALSALGDARKAARRFRKVHLTRYEYNRVIKRNVRRSLVITLNMGLLVTLALFLLTFFLCPQIIPEEHPFADMAAFFLSGQIIMGFASGGLLWMKFDPQTSLFRRWAVALEQTLYAMSDCIILIGGARLAFLNTRSLTELPPWFPNLSSSHNDAFGPSLLWIAFLWIGSMLVSVCTLRAFMLIIKFLRWSRHGDATVQ